jgi:quercetin dioxygenase-like cupin family protein
VIPQNLVDVMTMDTARVPWSMFTVEQTGAQIPTKALHSDPETGMQIFLMRYTAGFTNTWHTHPCAHGMFVLDGVLKTHQGEHGPGSFVWFPEGGWMEHGATDNDCTFLFIANKPFGICYESDEDHPYPMTTTAAS